MEMARTLYSREYTGDTYARGKVNEIQISPKHAIEIASFIRNKKTSDVISYLEQVIEGKKAIPFRRFNRKVAHKRGLDGWDAGRYPKKASAAYIRLLHSVIKNAEYLGLDTENLEIVHAAANRGRAFRGIFPRAMGRATPKRKETVNIEIVVREVQ
ncbi:MAG: 50S ribosomal protein L22 [Methanolinea sp.]|nr:50S ribosomal protein L22 [Methanolinea sp.]